MEGMESPLVSVVIPNYNYGRYLEARIQSILNQTYPNIELILLDDASTDDSKDILERYKGHAKVAHVVFNTINTGSPFVQWNRGITLAKGKYIWIAEADDLCEPVLLEKLIPVMEQHSQAAIAFAGSYLIDEENHVMKNDMNKWKNPSHSYAVYDGKAYAEHNLYWRSYIANASSAVFRKDFVDEARMKQCMQMRCSGDWLFWFYLTLKGDVIERYELLNRFRQHTQKVTAKAEINGKGKNEDIEIIRLMEQELTQLSKYKRNLRRGMLYNRIAKLPATEEVKKQLWRTLHQKLNGTRWDGWFERLNRFARLFCPFVVTMKRERLMPHKKGCKMAI